MLEELQSDPEWTHHLGQIGQGEWWANKEVDVSKHEKNMVYLASNRMLVPSTIHTINDCFAAAQVSGLTQAHLHFHAAVGESRQHKTAFDVGLTMPYDQMQLQVCNNS